MTICSKVCHIWQSSHRYGGLRSPANVRMEGYIWSMVRFCGQSGVCFGIGMILWSFLQDRESKIAVE
jgi:hypothetical protein